MEDFFQAANLLVPAFALERACLPVFFFGLRMELIPEEVEEEGCLK
jgi:hypothetical protein